MKPITFLTSILSLAPTILAQYSGTITTEHRGTCPIPLREGDDTSYSYDPARGNLCIKLDKGDFYTQSYHASLLGYAETPEADKPAKFGGCSDEACTQCELFDTARRTDRPGTIESECVEFSEKPYLFVGVPDTKQDL
ncbi:hypothetical protein BDV06DRAFT_188187 [Aspergillus oleicola]